MRAERLVDDGVDNEPRDDRAVRIRSDHARRDDLFDDGDDALGGEGGLLLAAEEAPHLHVPLVVGALRVDDRNVRVQRRHRPDRAVAVRTLHLPNQRIHRGEIALRVGAERIEREPMRAGHVAPDHPVMAVLLDLEQRLARGERGGLRSATNRVEGPHARIAEPAEDQPLRTSGRHHLVVDQIRCHPSEGQVATPLSDDLVPCGEGDAVSEAFDGNGVAVVDVRGDRVAHAAELGSGRSGHAAPRGRASAARRRPLQPRRRCEPRS